jgi:hypothetical protein
MAHVRQTLCEEEQQAERTNTSTGPQGPAAHQEQPQASSAPAPSTRIPDTPNINATAAVYQRINGDSTQHLRIRNAIQREEIRTTNRALREIHSEMGQLRSEAKRAADEADTHRKRIQEYRAELRKTRKWMQACAFVAAFLFLCCVFYAVWCWVNGPEFEFQRRIVRRNLGVEQVVDGQSRVRC